MGFIHLHLLESFIFCHTGCYFFAGWFIAVVGKKIPRKYPIQIHQPEGAHHSYLEAIPMLRGHPPLNRHPFFENQSGTWQAAIATRCDICLKLQTNPIPF